MNPWDTYTARNSLHGATTRDRAKYNLMNRLTHQIPTTLSYQTATVDNIERDIVVLDSDNMNQKTICSMPGEDIRHGALVEWAGHRWLVAEHDAHTEIYAKCIMLQCNYLLKWINNSGQIVERWCIVEDGTRYLTGEYQDSSFVATKGDSRIAVTLPKDSETLALGRDFRFIIDDYGVPDPLAYRMSKPFKLGGSFDENGVISVVMTECNTEQDDNLELHIANYYKYFPKDKVDIGSASEDTKGDIKEDISKVEETKGTGRKGWI